MEAIHKTRSGPETHRWDGSHRTTVRAFHTVSSQNSVFSPRQRELGPFCGLSNCADNWRGLGGSAVPCGHPEGAEEEMPANRSHVAEMAGESGRPDLNRGPRPPKGRALPGCATPRCRRV